MSRARALTHARYLLSTVDPGALDACESEVTFVGRSNVGKSSLLNALCKADALARVSKTPGRTRTVNVFETGKGRWLVDLPGYGFAVGPREERDKWGAMIAAYLTRPSLKMVFVLIDTKVGPTQLDYSMADYLRVHGVPWRPVATKTDQWPRASQKLRREELAKSLGVKPEELAWTTARLDLGVENLRQDVATLLGY